MYSFPKGVLPILATPFTEGGDVDYASIRTLTQGLIRMGVSGITLFGIASEYYKLSDEEKQLITKTVISEAKGLVPVITSVTSHATELAVREARNWQAAGADMLMLLPPFFLKPGADALKHHVEQVCEAVSIPVMLQYAPEQTGVTISAPFFIDLFQRYPQLCFKIENKPPGPLISSLVKQTEGKAQIYIGNAGFQMLEGLQRGAVGLMPGCSMSDIYIDIYQQFMTNRPQAIQLHNQLLSVLNVIRQNVEQIIASEKRILKRRGLIQSDYCRKPGFTYDSVYEEEFETYFAAIAPLFRAV